MHQMVAGGAVVCVCVLSEASSFHFIAYEILRVNEMPLILEWSHSFDVA